MTQSALNWFNFQFSYIISQIFIYQFINNLNTFRITAHIRCISSDLDIKQNNWSFVRCFLLWVRFIKRFFFLLFFVVSTLWWNGYFSLNLLFVDFCLRCVCDFILEEANNNIIKKKTKNYIHGRLRNLPDCIPMQQHYVLHVDENSDCTCFY